MSPGPLTMPDSGYNRARRIYVLVSFDYGGSSSVCLRAVTSSYEDASGAFQRLEAQFKEYNPRSEGDGMMVELLEVDGDFVDDGGFNLFWESRVDGFYGSQVSHGSHERGGASSLSQIRVVLSNNR
jgi:hypothetical protein